MQIKAVLFVVKCIFMSCHRPHTNIHAEMCIKTEMYPFLHFHKTPPSFLFSFQSVFMNGCKHALNESFA